MNFTATLHGNPFTQDVGTVVLELDYVEFTCPVGYIFEVNSILMSIINNN